MKFTTDTLTRAQEALRRARLQIKILRFSPESDSPLLYRATGLTSIKAA